jgi:hypothetical protein
MRLSKPVDLHRISQALGKGSCPICAFLRNEQSALLKGGLPPGEVTDLCNFHAWALAAAVDSRNAAEVLLNVLGQPVRQAEHSCSFCSRLKEEEIIQLKDLVTQMSRGLITEWMRQQGTLCRSHAEHLRQLAPVKLHEIIDDVIGRTIADVKSGLEHLLGADGKGDRAGSGVLGRAAEFLTSQRGIHP